MLSISPALYKQPVSKLSFDKINTRSAKNQHSASSTLGYDDPVDGGQPIAHGSVMTHVDHTQSKERFKWLHNAAMVQQDVILLNQPVEANTGQFQQKLIALASNKHEFNQLMYSAFGDGVSPLKLEALRERVLDRDFSWMPQVEYIDPETLHGADGAYAASTNTIYLSSNSTDVSMDFLVYAEELGHCIDQMVNTDDALGDEGALFAAYLVGAPLSDADRAALKTENDSGTITVDGKIIDVEFSKLSAEMGRFSDNFKNWVRKAREFMRRAEAAFTGLIDDIGEILKAVVTRPFDVLSELGDGLERVFVLILDGKFEQARTEIRHMLTNSGKIAMSLLPEVVSMTFNAAVMAVDRARGAVSERSLNIEEIRYLQNIFGNSIDYNRIVIISGGTKDQWGMRAHVVGNDIFMPNSLNDGTPMFEADGSISPGGLALLGHEVAHVWQFQKFGTEYIGHSLVAQFYDGENDTYDWYHEVDAGTAFEDMNPEQQAGIAEIIGQAMHHRIENGEEPILTLAALNAVISHTNIVLTDVQFEIFLAARLVLDPKANSPRMLKPPRLPEQSPGFSAQSPGMPDLRKVELQAVGPSV